MLQLFHSGGLGGQIYKVSIENEEFLVKCELYEQSLNEFVAHSLISAIGLPAPKAALVKIDKAELAKMNLSDVPIDVFGAVCYLPGLKRVSDKEVFKSDDQSRILTYLELLLLDRMLGNEDDTVEIYEDAVGKLYLLDLGEALISTTLLFSFIKKDDYLEWLTIHLKSMNAARISYNIENAKKTCLYRMKLNNYMDESMLQEAALDITIRLAELDMRKMRSCLLGLNKAYGEQVSEVYRQYLKKLRYACRLIVKYTDK